MLGVANVFREGHPLLTIMCLLLCGVCDMFDGAVAATKKRTEEEKLFGIQIDSLCDLVSFGVLPAVICMDFSRAADGSITTQGVVAGALLALSSVIRLAYFNVQETTRDRTEKRKSYMGMPVTLVSIFLPFLIIVHCLIDRFIAPFRWDIYLPICVALLAAWEVSKLPVQKPYGWKKIFMVVFGFALLAGVILLRDQRPRVR
jgi:CDP-diacylglycerol--serine O-phosphatidyltransferase